MKLKCLHTSRSALLSHSFKEKQTGLAVNIAIICLILSFPYFMIFQLLRLPISKLFVIPTVLVYLVSILLMRFGLNTLGKLLIIVGTSASLYSYAVMLGKGAGAQLLLYGMIPLPLFLFKPKQRLEIILGSLIPIFSSFGLEFSNYSGPFFNEELSTRGQFWLYILASATTFSILILSAYANFRASQTHEVQLEEKNRELEQNILLLNQSNHDLSSALANLKKSQSEIQSMAQQATLGAIMRGIVHEVKGPLTAIRACCSVILMDAQLQDGTRDRVSNIQNYINQLSELTKTLLADSGSIAWMDSPLDLNRLVEQVLKLVDNEGFVKKIKILRSIPNELPTVKGSSAYISQALLNLLINALRFSPENTAITVVVRVETNWIRIQVSDQGPGVSEEIRHTLFQAGVTTAQPGGTNIGLGLHFVQRVADAHGGTVQLIKTGDSGSTFELSLPIVQS